jgi:hypothetical protein
MDLAVVAEEMEGFSDNLPKIEGFCRFPDPFLARVYRQACIPGNQENATVSQPMGLARADTAITFSSLGEA